MKKTTKKQAIFHFLFIALVVITFVILFLNVDINKIIRVISTVNWSYITAGIGLMLVYILSEAQCLRILSGSLGSPIGVPKAFAYSSIDIYFSAITPSATGGQPFMAYYMSKDDIPISKSSIVILFNTILYTIALVLLVGFSLILKPSLLFEDNSIFLICLIFGIVISFVLVTACLICMFSNRLAISIGTFFIRIGAKIRIIKNKEKKIESLKAHIAEYHSCAKFFKNNPLIALKVLFFNLVQRIAIFSVSYVVYAGLGFSRFNFIDLFTIQAITTITTYSIPIPGAVGASEAIFLILYKDVYPDPDTLATAMLLTRGISYYLCVAFCAVITILNHLLGSKKIFKKENKL